MKTTKQTSMLSHELTETKRSTVKDLMVKWLIAARQQTSHPCINKTKGIQAYD